MNLAWFLVRIAFGGFVRRRRETSAESRRQPATEQHPAPDRAHAGACVSSRARLLGRKVTEGKSRREAMRALKRYVARSVWRLWQECGVGRAEAEKELKTDEQREAVRPFPLAKAV